ncbi:hypothetical protein Ocin01_09908 [Orchesella cincta]|uniref:Uncharacterized protein n=1 Tax=Orchesella cincta TaxID=48709 RepID=A0A1D2MVR5_ORCCI|nr:hypothetical protein Ocin01_09908 [Orchesella cincta]
MSRKSSIERNFNKDVEMVRDNFNQAKITVLDYFGLESKSRRSRLSETREIIIDPVSFFIGAFGATIVGLLADEVREEAENAADSNNSRLNRTIARIISFPLKSAVRVVTGGCIYVAVDNVTLQLFDRRWPSLSGALTAVCFANGGNLPVFVGSVLGLAVLAHTADLLFNAVSN